MIIWTDNDKETERDPRQGELESAHKTASPVEIIGIITLAISITFLLGLISFALHILKIS